MARPWWQEPLRIYQANLRLVDGDQDPSDIIDQAKELSANVLVANAGGAFAFYPTELDCQDRAPTLQGDLFGGLVAEGRKSGIRVVARLEICVKSKIIYDKHPEWFYIDADGKPLNSRGRIATCFCGPGFVEQVCAIIREIMHRCQPDGIFFNGWGHHEQDADGYRGPCQCPGSIQAFREFCGKAVPTKERWENRSDPASEDYHRFRHSSAAAFLKKIRGFIREQNPDAVLFHPMGLTPLNDAPGYSPGEMLSELGDIQNVFWCELGSAPFDDRTTWAYWATEQGKIGRTAGHRTNVLIDYPMCGSYRHACHADGWMGLGIARTLAGGAIPQLHFIGPMGVQEDRQGIPIMKELMAFARTNETVYDSPESASPAALFLSHATSLADQEVGFLRAYRGWYRALARGHVPFDVVPSPEFGTAELDAIFGRYRTLILPNVWRLTEAEKEAVDVYVQQGGKLIASLFTALGNGLDPAPGSFQLHCLKGIEVVKHQWVTLNTYCRLGQDRLPGFPDEIDMLPVHGGLLHVRSPANADAMFNMTRPEPNCIPEDAYIREQTDWPGLVLMEVGKGSVAYLPWAPDQMYHQSRLPALEALLLSVVQAVSPDTRRFLTTDAPGAVEVTLYRRSGQLLLHLVNSTGCCDGHVDGPITLTDVNFSMEGQFTRVRALASKSDLEFNVQRERTHWVLPQLKLYEVLELAVD